MKNFMTFINFIIILSIFTVLITGCNGDGVTPAPEISPSPTTTSLPTATSSPNATSSPSPTPTSAGIEFETKTIQVKDKIITVEIADTPQKRELGLMYRTSLDENKGMLFIFPTPSKLSFWMKNTFIPLSIAFIDEEGTIKEIENMEPETTITHVSKDLCKYALEVNQGWFERNNINVGDKVYLD